MNANASWKTTRIVESHRFVVAHIHLFKNAGTSVERGLQSYFGDRWRSFDLPASNTRITQPLLSQFLEENPEVQAVSSHQLRPPIESTTRFTFLPVVYVRNPLDRIRSAWEFERHQGGVSPSSRVAAQSTLLEWIDWHRSRGSTQCTNFQTYALSEHRNETNGGPIRARPIAEHLESARGFLCSLPAFGVVELYDKSWYKISTWIGESFPGFAAPAVRANTTTSESTPLEDRLAGMRMSIGEGAFEQLYKDNAADQALYEFALARLGSDHKCL